MIERTPVASDQIETLVAIAAARVLIVGNVESVMINQVAAEMTAAHVASRVKTSSLALNVVLSLSVANVMNAMNVVSVLNVPSASRGQHNRMSRMRR